MLAPWVSEEMQTADLEDKRLNERLSKVLSALGERPTASIPAACGGWDETIAAYRFFDNEKVTYERILAPHAERTLERIAAQPVVLLVQDTTELEFTRPRQQMTGAGFLDGSARRAAAPAGGVYPRRHAAGKLLGDDLDPGRTARGNACPTGAASQKDSAGREGKLALGGGVAAGPRGRGACSWGEMRLHRR
jgi:hypothetical protein